MNKLFYIGMLVAMLMTSAVFYGQNKPDRNKLKALKVAFFTERLSLSAKEAEVFWPLYNEYEEKKESLREREKSEIYEKLKQAESIDESEAQNLLQRYLELEERQEELDKEYFNRIAKTITARKTLMMFRAEYEFRRQLIKRYSEKQSGRRN
ncbi:hypothetical protein PP178_12050 [Zeaxanthinibacter sp. PT1]|uniref:hypothetical protein n=1 Tax=Zeaxanthinibacter TaxID=561554 RepID=UPI00234BF4BB|nr:hypothetical protein [Zeaxanthinibacter sp. PT1]MDC6352286.1 hypothetical protein [Zeaxanthinibacter sp. PT1]